MTTPVPNNKAARLKALQRCRVLNTLPETFDNLTHLAASICDTPIALVGLVDKSCQGLKSKVGLEATQVSREPALCARAIANPNEICRVSTPKKR